MPGLFAPIAGSIVRAVAERIARAGHGGALLVAHDVQRAVFETSPKYRFREADTLLAASFSEQGAGPDLKRYTAHPKRPELFQYALDHVADFANVDGAVLLDFELNVYGYGAFVGDELSPLIEGLDRMTQRPTRLDLGDVGGMRHQAAARFCAGGLAGSARAAFVASQDRTITLFFRISGEIVYRIHDLDSAVV